jgi:hypothetical protein
MTPLHIPNDGGGEVNILGYPMAIRIHCRAHAAATAGHSAGDYNRKRVRPRDPITTAAIASLIHSRKFAQFADSNSSLATSVSALQHSG